MYHLLNVNYQLYAHTVKQCTPYIGNHSQYCPRLTRVDLIVQKDLPTSLVSDFIVKIISKLYHAYVRNTKPPYYYTLQATESLARARNKFFRTVCVKIVDYCKKCNTSGQVASIQPIFSRWLAFPGAHPLPVLAMLTSFL